jgi:hypothetical protein
MYRTTFRKARLPLVLALATAAIALGCGGGSDSPAAATGTVRVSLTDAPACGYDAVNVTVSKVRIHRSESAGDDDGAWSDIDITPARKIDLLELQNGVLESLGDVKLEAGRYAQVRLVLEPNGAGAPANSIVLTGDPGKAEVPLRTPSGQQSGLKLVHGFEVAAEETMDLVLDFDACRSVVKAGNSGNYNLTPVISVIPIAAAGKLAIDGSVGETGAGAVVTAQGHDAEGHPIVLRATTARADGSFSLSPLPVSGSGDYTLVVAKPGRATVVVKGVPATEGEITAMAPIDLGPVVDTALVQGEVSVPPSPADSPVQVRAIRAVAGLQVEVASTTATDAPYAVELPAVPARVADYAAGTLAFSDASPPSEPALYVLEATVQDGALPSKSATVALDGSADVTQNFDFTMP